MQWVIDTKDVYNTKILNLSLGSPANSSYRSDPLAKAVDEAIKSGITVVVAAGNSGPAKKTILCPGNSPHAITIGAVDDKRTPEVSDDSIASFSSRGPTKEGIRKPDLVAPGVDIVSTSNKNTKSYIALSGTSMATPIVSGTCALLYERDDSLTPREVKYLLKSSCISLNDRQENQGAGILNLKNLFDKDISHIPPQSPNPSEQYEIQSSNFIPYILLFLLLSKKI
nr:S8 family serine peptidase [Clostridiisalibacter paucivorans]